MDTATLPSADTPRHADPRHDSSVVTDLATGGVAGVDCTLATLGVEPGSSQAFATFTLDVAGARALGPFLNQRTRLALGGVLPALQPESAGGSSLGWTPDPTLPTAPPAPQLTSLVVEHAQVFLNVVDCAGPELEQATPDLIAGPFANAREALREALTTYHRFAAASPEQVTDVLRSYHESALALEAELTAARQELAANRETAAELLKAAGEKVTEATDALAAERARAAGTLAAAAEAHAQEVLRLSEALNAAEAERDRLKVAADDWAQKAIAHHEARETLTQQLAGSERQRDEALALQAQTQAELTHARGELDGAFQSGFEQASALAQIARALSLDATAPPQQILAALANLQGRASAALPAHEAILQERRRQQEQEGYNPEHDDLHEQGQLAAAGAAYAWAASLPSWPSAPPEFWPFGPGEFKEAAPRRALVKAGALIIAELQRRERAEAPVLPPPYATGGGF